MIRHISFSGRVGVDIRLVSIGSVIVLWIEMSIDMGSICYWKSGSRIIIMIDNRGNKRSKYTILESNWGIRLEPWIILLPAPGIIIFLLVMVWISIVIVIMNL